jgi:hypothetical protein
MAAAASNSVLSLIHPELALLLTRISRYFDEQTENISTRLGNSMASPLYLPALGNWLGIDGSWST